MEGKVSFSRSGATSKNVNWLSLIIPNDANLIKEYLQEFRDTQHIPVPLSENGNSEYFQTRYDASIDWIENNNHAVISNGPYYLKSYAPESRTITVGTFEDESYPFKVGTWSEFERTELPTITAIDMKQVIQKGEELNIRLEVENSDSILYFLTNNEGNVVSTNKEDVKDKQLTISIPTENTKDLGIGANNIKIFAISNSVLKPDFYESSFIVANNEETLPTSSSNSVEFNETETNYWIWIIPILAIIGFAVYLKRR